MRSSSEQRHRLCSVCRTEKACLAVDIDSTNRHLCLLHFSICDKNIPNSTKKSQLKSRIIDKQEYSRQSIEVKDLWKEATADVILKMFEYEMEEQRQARLSEAPAIAPRSISVGARDGRDEFPSTIKSLVPRQSSSDSPDADILATPSYAWRRGSLAEPTVEMRDSSVFNTRKRASTTSLWRTGLQKQSKKEVLEEAERILQVDRNNAEGAYSFSKRFLSQDSSNKCFLGISVVHYGKTYLKKKLICLIILFSYTEKEFYFISSFRSSST